MAYKYLDQAGLRTVWDKIKQNFGLLDGISINGTLIEPTNKIANIPIFSNANTTAAGLVPPTASSSAIFLSGDGTWRTPPGTTSVATTAINGLMSADDKIKLNSVATSADRTGPVLKTMGFGKSLNEAMSTAAGTAMYNASDGSHFGLVVGDNIELEQFTVAGTSDSIYPNIIKISSVNTTYETATSEADGLMSAADKQTLDNIVSTGGEPNQNAFSYVTVGSSTVAADAKTDTLTLVGAGSVSLSATTGTDTITITGSTSVATTAANGWMSADMVKDVTGFHNLTNGNFTIDGVSTSGAWKQSLLKFEPITHYGSCGTSPSQAIKDVVPPDNNQYQLVHGAWIAVKFTYTNTATDTLQLRVYGTEAREIKYKGSACPSYALRAGSVYLFVYERLSDSTGYWHLVGDITSGVGTGLTIDSNGVINHSNSVTASTIGPTSSLSAATVAIPNFSYDAQGHITAASTINYTVDKLAASAITSGTFSSAVHAPVSGATYSIASRQYVNERIASAVSGVASFQGIASSATSSTATNPIESDYLSGYYWLVNGTGSTIGIPIVGQTCFDGDMIFAIKDKTGSGSTADFTVVQQNISPMTDDDIAAATPLT